MPGRNTAGTRGTVNMRRQYSDTWRAHEDAFFAQLRSEDRGHAGAHGCRGSRMLRLSAVLGHVWVVCGWEGAADALKTIMRVVTGASNQPAPARALSSAGGGSSIRARAARSSGRLADMASRRGTACPQLTPAARSTFLLDRSKAALHMKRREQPVLEGGRQVGIMLAGPRTHNEAAPLDRRRRYPTVPTQPPSN